MCASICTFSYIPIWTANMARRVVALVLPDGRVWTHHTSYGYAINPSPPPGPTSHVSDSKPGELPKTQRTLVQLGLGQLDSFHLRTNQLLPMAISAGFLSLNTGYNLFNNGYHWSHLILNHWDGNSFTYLLITVSGFAPSKYPWEISMGLELPWRAPRLVRNLQNHRLKELFAATAR